MSDPVFLTLPEILEIHQSQIELYGGTLGVRDLHLLQSALAQPEASFMGAWLYPSLVTGRYPRGCIPQPSPASPL